MNKILYHSTRDHRETATASQAILKGLAGKGGLFVPDRIPRLETSLSDMADLSYQEIAYEVMKLFLKILRKKIDTGDGQTVIKTVRGVGYKLEAGA